MFRWEEDDSDYIPKLYYSSPDFDPERASDEIEEGLNKRYKKSSHEYGKATVDIQYLPTCQVYIIQQAKMKQLRNQNDNKLKILNNDKRI